MLPLSTGVNWLEITHNGTAMVKIDIKDYLNRVPELPKELREEAEFNRLLIFLEANLKVSENIKNMDLEENHEVPRSIYFVMVGVVRGYKFDRQHQVERDVFLWPSRSFAVDIDCFISQQESSLTIEPYEGSTIASLTYAQFKQLLVEFPYLDTLPRHLHADNEQYNNSEFSIHDMSSSERFDAITARFPNEQMRFVPKHWLIRWLGVSERQFRAFKKNRPDSAANFANIPKDS